MVNYEDIGSVYPTKMPKLNSNADIQTALRMYHYGSETVPATEALAATNSIVGFLRDSKNRIAALESLGIGSFYQTTPPTGTVADGTIWVDEDTTAPIIAEVKYQASTPSGTLAVGSLWVDSDSSPLKMYVYSGTEWREIGA